MPLGDLNQIGPVAGGAVARLETGVQQIAPLLRRVSPFITLLRIALVLRLARRAPKKKPARRRRR